MPGNGRVFVLGIKHARARSRDPLHHPGSRLSIRISHPHDLSVLDITFTPLPWYQCLLLPMPVCSSLITASRSNSKEFGGAMPTTCTFTSEAMCAWVG